ncbi:HAD family hydrolase [Streptomyces sp. NPDC020794]|uniref:HAD family hydrolase n=1 Tax=unclassified Streptomyces TaxID=2593676 RepID=UPI0036EB19A9
MAAPTAYSLIATDLDGTLLRGDDTLSDRSRAVLARVAEAGARHLVVTGRPAPRVRPLLDELGGAGLAVCGQGAQLYDAAADRLLWSVTLDRELAETALGKIEAEVGLLYAAVDQDGVDGLTLIEPGYVMPHPTLPAVRVHRRDDLWTEPISKVLLRHPSLSDDELASAARGVVGSLATVTMSGPGTVELQPCGVTKATGLALAAAHLGLTPAATIAFGDMPNDIPMFDWAARGVAMANAHPELKAVADEVTLSNEDDGIAVVLERLFSSRTDRSRESGEPRGPRQPSESPRPHQPHQLRQSYQPYRPNQPHQSYQ